MLDSGSNTDYVDFSSRGRSQFIDQLEAFLNQAKEETDTDYYDIHEETVEREEDFGLTNFEDADINKLRTVEKEAPEGQKTIPEMSEFRTAEMEQVMTSGMQFLAELYKMSTGKELGLENQQIKINKETGEVTCIFHLFQG